MIALPGPGPQHTLGHGGGGPLRPRFADEEREAQEWARKWWNQLSTSGQRTPQPLALVWPSGPLGQDPRSEAEGDGEQVMTEAADTHLNSPGPVLGL